jgi:hypothetical protein
LAAAFFGAGFSSESESESLELSFLAAAFFFGAGLASEDSESESLEDSFLAAFLAGAAFLTGLASEELSESEELSFLAAFLTGAFLAGFSSLESESEDEDSSTFFFFCGTAAFSTTFLALLDSLLLAETLEAALGLLATTLTGSSDEESESLLETCFFDFFFSRVRKYQTTALR